MSAGHRKTITGFVTDCGEPREGHGIPAVAGPAAGTR